ncbi:MAG: hypothetical protein CMJ75_19285 [Planctomycetaceae bacterium]|nr:hypothetical protein [Planctomycetaceae bacterium]
MSETDLLDVDALAARWNIHRQTVLKRKRERLKAGKDFIANPIPLGHKGGFGQGVKYHLSDVIAYENQLAKEAGAQEEGK